MVFLFGQVEDNLRRKGRNDMIVRFSRFAGEVSQEAGLSPIQATRLGYEACKPEMVCDEKDGQPQISVTFPEKNKGMGSAVIYQVR